jgi:hypothetical protein
MVESIAMAVRVWEDGATYYVREPEAGRHAPERVRVVTPLGEVLTRRRHGYAARVEVRADGAALPRAALLRAAAAVGRAVEKTSDGLDRHVRVVLRDTDVSQVLEDDDGVSRVELREKDVTSTPVHHATDAAVEALIRAHPVRAASSPSGQLPERAARSVLFFESLMNTDMPHNDGELSQGVLHMASTLTGSGTRTVLANVKMSITGTERPVIGRAELRRR